MPDPGALHSNQPLKVRRRRKRALEALEVAKGSSCMVALAVPPHVAERLVVPDIEGALRADELHITIALVETSDCFGLAQALKRMWHHPVSVRLSHTSFLDGRGEDDVAVVLEPRCSTDLQVLRQRVLDRLDSAGYSWKDTYAFRPHVTLAYAPREEAEENFLEGPMLGLGHPFTATQLIICDQAGNRVATIELESDDSPELAKLRRYPKGTPKGGQFMPEGERRAAVRAKANRKRKAKRALRIGAMAATGLAIGALASRGKVGNTVVGTGRAEAGGWKPRGAHAEVRVRVGGKRGERVSVEHRSGEVHGRGTYVSNPRFGRVQYDSHAGEVKNLYYQPGEWVSGLGRGTRRVVEEPRETARAAAQAARKVPVQARAAAQRERASMTHRKRVRAVLRDYSRPALNPATPPAPRTLKPRRPVRTPASGSLGPIATTPLGPTSRRIDTRAPASSALVRTNQQEPTRFGRRARAQRAARDRRRIASIVGGAHHGKMTVARTKPRKIIEVNGTLRVTRRDGTYREVHPSTPEGEKLARRRKRVAKSDKVREVMLEFKAGDLHSGKGGSKVESRRQALAIALAEQRRAQVKVAKHPGHADQSVHGVRHRRGSRRTVGRKPGGRAASKLQGHDRSGRFTGKSNRKREVQALLASAGLAYGAHVVRANLQRPKTVDLRSQADFDRAFNQLTQRTKG